MLLNSLCVCHDMGGKPTHCLSRFIILSYHSFMSKLLFNIYKMIRQFVGGPFSLTYSQIFSKFYFPFLFASAKMRMLNVHCVLCTELAKLYTDKELTSLS